MVSLFIRKMETPNTSTRTILDPSKLMEIKSINHTAEDMRGELTNALVYCKSLLAQNNLLTSTPPEHISSISMAIGKTIYKTIVSMLEKRKLILEEEWITREETDGGEYLKREFIISEEADSEGKLTISAKTTDCEGEFNGKLKTYEKTDSQAEFNRHLKILEKMNSESESDQRWSIFEETDSEESSEVPDSPEWTMHSHYRKKDKRNESIPNSYKKKALAIAKAHPTWSLKTLQKNGCARLKHKMLLKKWEKDLQHEGTRYNKLKDVEMKTLQRFKEARNRNEQVTTRNLQEWAMDAAAQVFSKGKIYKFHASNNWINRFKAKYRIKKRRITEDSSTDQGSLRDDRSSSIDSSDEIATSSD